MPDLRQRERDGILNGKPGIRLVALGFSGFATGNILDHPLIVKNFAADFIANNTRVLRYPDHSTVPAINLGFKIYDFALFAYEANKFGSTSRLNVKLGPDICECGNEVIS
jgi:hypothetical protein